MAIGTIVCRRPPVTLVSWPISPWLAVSFNRPQTVGRWGGTLGGIRDFHKILLAEQAALGMQGTLLAGGCNQILSAGFGLDGSTGNTLFADLNSGALTYQRIQPVAVKGAANLELVIDPSQLSAVQASDYSLEFTGADQATVTRLSDQHQYTFTSATPLAFDGLTLTLVGGKPEPEDSYLLTPWRHQAGQIAVTQDDPTTLGFAAADQALASQSRGPGDNSNLQQLLTWFAGEGLSHSLPCYYDVQIAKVATKTRQANSRMQAEQSLRDSAMAERDNRFAVNLDEEAANLIRFQQYYQANIKVMAAGVAIMDDLLAIV